MMDDIDVTLQTSSFDVTLQTSSFDDTLQTSSFDDTFQTSSSDDGFSNLQDFADWSMDIMNGMEILDVIDESKTSPLLSSSSSYYTDETVKTHIVFNQLKYDVYPQLPDIMDQLSQCILDREAVVLVQKWVLLMVLGKRRVNKVPIPITCINSKEEKIWKYIEHEFALEARKERVLSFMMDRKVSKRLISYFVVHFVKINPTCYYLDTSQYPYKICSNIADSIYKLETTVPQAIFINVHREYQACLNAKGPLKCNAPYYRMNTVVNERSEQYSLSAVPFYLWLDRIGGIEAFELLKDKVKPAKALHEARRRILKEQNKKIRIKELCVKQIGQSTNNDPFITRVISHPYLPSCFKRNKTQYN